MFGKKKWLLFFVIILVLAGGLNYTVFNFKSNASSKNSVSTKGDKVDYSKIKRDTDVKVESNGSISIKRNKKELTTMGKEDSWTLFVYMTGTDLEAFYEKATIDLKEMWKADFNNYNEENVKIIIQTGGCDKWRTKGISSKKIQRYMLQYNELKLLDEQKNDSMGDENTLYEFLKWGTSNYAAEHMGVVFWNHGSGISQGICCDTIHNNDTLMLSEVECAFARVYGNMTDKFELIGFDTCLSGALEYANALAPYGKYMVASADVENGDGWYYTDIMNYLFKNPDATGLDLGKVIADSYTNFYYNTEAGKVTTMAVYDLNKVDNVCIAINDLARNIYVGLKNNDVKYTDIVEVINNSLFYDKTNIDLGSLIYNLGKKFNQDMRYINNELDNMVVYNQIGQDYVVENAIGISMFLSLDSMKLNELNVYRNTGFSPYWIKLLEYFKAKKNKIEDYIEFDWENSKYFYEDDFGYIQYENPLISEREAYKKISKNNEYDIDGFVNRWAVLFDVNNIFKNFFNVLFEDSDTRTYKDLSKKALLEGDNVYTNIYKKEGTRLINIGVNAEVNYNEKNNTFKSGFDGNWFMLADGQVLATKVVTKKEKYIIYEAPVLIDSKESTIRIKVYLENGNMSYYSVLGVWDAAQSWDNITQTNNDLPQNRPYAPRGYLPLYSGTTIIPIYEAIDTSTREVYKIYGNSYIAGTDSNIQYSKINDGEFVSTLQVESLNSVKICDIFDNVSLYNGEVISKDTMLCMN